MTHAKLLLTDLLGPFKGLVVAQHFHRGEEEVLVVAAGAQHELLV
jgi:hypothetical protein